MEKMGNKRREKPFQPRTIDDPAVKKWPFRNRMGQALSSCCSFQQVDVGVLYIHNNWSIFMPGWNKLLALVYWLYYCTVSKLRDMSDALTNLYLFLQLLFPSQAFSLHHPGDQTAFSGLRIRSRIFFFSVSLYMQQIPPSLKAIFQCFTFSIFFFTIANACAQIHLTLSLLSFLFHKICNKTIQAMWGTISCSVADNVSNQCFPSSD